MPRNRKNKGSKKGHVEKAFGKILVTRVVTATLTEVALYVTTESATSDQLGFYSGRLAALSDLYQYCRFTKLLVEVSPSQGDISVPTNPFILGYELGYSITAPVLTQIVEMPWVSPWYGGTTGASCMTMLRRDNIPRGLLRPPNLPWLKTRNRGGSAPEFHVHGTMWVRLMFPATSIPGDNVSFIIEYAAEFKDPISGGVNPAKSSGMYEKSLEMVRHLPDITEEEKDDGSGRKSVNDEVAPSTNFPAKLVAKDAVKSVIALPEDNESTGSIESFQ